MKIDVFAKNRQTFEGKKFTSYLSRLTKKNGDTIPVQVKFKEDVFSCDIPDVFPATVSFEKKDANLQTYEYPSDDGEIKVGYTLWLNRWENMEYEDNSLDEFE